MKVPFGKSPPDATQIKLLEKLGFNLSTMTLKHGYYRLYIPDVSQVRYKLEHPGADKTLWTIYYNDIAVISSYQNTASDDPYVMFNINAEAIEAALAKTSTTSPVELILETVPAAGGSGAGSTVSTRLSTNPHGHFKPREATNNFGRVIGSVIAERHATHGTRDAAVAFDALSKLSNEDLQKCFIM